MANDFKRMWTKEELKDTYVLTNSDLDGKTLDEIDFYDDIVSLKSGVGKKIRNYRWLNVRETIYILQFINNENDYIYNCNSNVIYSVNVLGDELYFDGDDLTISDDFENLVRETPTDVSIIEDQGKLELVLEHDGNVLAINDTPNQFLQRRLDKVSFYYNPYDEPPQYDSLGECLADNLNKLHNGMFVNGNITYGDTTTYGYYIITSVDTLTINMVPISPIPTTLNNMTGFVSEVSIRLDGSTWQYKVTGFTGAKEYATLVDISIIDSIYFY